MDRGSLRTKQPIRPFISKRASTHDQRPEPYHDHCGIGLLGGREPHLQSYLSAAGIQRSRAIRREPTQHTVRKLALSDRPHDWGKVRRFLGERQAAVWISSFSPFLGRITAIQPPCHPPLGNDTEVADRTPAGSRRALSGVFFKDGSLRIGFAIADSGAFGEVFTPLVA